MTAVMRHRIGEMVDEVKVPEWAKLYQERHGREVKMSVQKVNSDIAAKYGPLVEAAVFVRDAINQPDFLGAKTADLNDILSADKMVSVLKAAIDGLWIDHG